MDQKQMETLIAAGVVEQVVAIRAEDAWECWVQGERVPKDLDNRVRSSRAGKEIRTWASLDTLHRWIRERGWELAVEVEG